MTELLYVITAQFLNREQDGQDPQDGSPLQMAYMTKETWAYPASTPIGDIMSKVNGYGGMLVNIAISEDRVSSERVREERIAEARARRIAEED